MSFLFSKKKAPAELVKSTQKHLQELLEAKDDKANKKVPIAYPAPLPAYSSLLCVF